MAALVLGRRLARRRSLALCCIAMLTFLAGCQDVSAPAPANTTPSPVALALPAELLRGSPPTAEVTTAGYVFVDAAGATLVESVVFEADGTPRPLATGLAPIWLGESAAAQLGDKLRSAGALRYAAVLARGRLAAPGAYGPAGKYRYELSGAALVPLVAQETSVGELLDHPATYQARLVRVVGGLLLSEKSALLVDRLGAGGLPASTARQIKLRVPLRDRALLDRLKGVSSGAVRFGQAQIEGFLRGSALVPISITLVS